jgi:hypothetical protein
MEKGRARVLTENITLRLTEEERLELEGMAKERGLSLSELSRELLVSNLRNGSPDARVVLSEVMALRALFLGVQKAVQEGKKADLADLTSQAEAHKFTMADKRIWDARAATKRPREAEVEAEVA